MDCNLANKDIVLDTLNSLGVAVILVYSVTDKRSFSAANGLLEEIGRRTSGSPRPVFLVANKIDLERQRVVVQREGKESAKINNCEFVEISVQFSHEIEELLRSLLEHVILKYAQDTPTYYKTTPTESGPGHFQGGQFTPDQPLSRGGTGNGTEDEEDWDDDQDFYFKVDDPKKKRSSASRYGLHAEQESGLMKTRFAKSCEDLIAKLCK